MYGTCLHFYRARNIQHWKKFFLPSLTRVELLLYYRCLFRIIKFTVTEQTPVTLEWMEEYPTGKKHKPKVVLVVLACIIADATNASAPRKNMKMKSGASLPRAGLMLLVVHTSYNFLKKPPHNVCHPERLPRTYFEKLQGLCMGAGFVQGRAALRIVRFNTWFSRVEKSHDTQSY